MRETAKAAPGNFFYLAMSSAFPTNIERDGALMNNYFNPVDWTVIVLYLVGIIALGIWFGKDQQNARNYFLGSKNVPWWSIGLSIVAAKPARSLSSGYRPWLMEGIFWVHPNGDRLCGRPDHYSP